MSQFEEQRIAALNSLGLLNTPPEERFDRITRLAHYVFAVPMAYISLIDEQHLWFKSKIGLDVSQIPRSISVCNQTLVGNKMLIIEDASKHPTFCQHPFVVKPPYIRFYAGIPLHTHAGYPVGTFCLCATSPKKFDEKDRKIFSELGALAERELQVTEMVEYDDLTGLYNRKGFLTNAQRMLRLCQRQQSKASLIFIDLNRFKQVNDTFGHLAGDQVLAHFGKMLSDHIRHSDIAARLYGDEFAVFSMDTSMSDAEALLARLRAKLVDSSMPGGLSQVQLTFSAGIAKYSGSGDTTIATLIQQADQAMYQHKEKSVTA